MLTFRIDRYNTCVPAVSVVLLKEYYRFQFSFLKEV